MRTLNEISLVDSPNSLHLNLPFFLVFGVDLIRGAYGLNDPFSFIMTFFGASFIILISLTLVLVFTIKMIRVYRRLKTPQTQEDRS